MDDVVEALDRLNETIKVAAMMITWAIFMFLYMDRTIIRLERWIRNWRNRKHDNCSRDSKRSM